MNIDVVVECDSRNYSFHFRVAINFLKNLYLSYFFVNLSRIESIELFTYLVLRSKLR